MKIYKHSNLMRLYQSGTTSLLVAFLTTTAPTSYAQIKGQVYYNQESLAVNYSVESHPQDPYKIRNMDVEIGYITDGTYAIFNELVIPSDNKPVSVTIMYSSGGAGGKVKFIADGYNSSGNVGINLGEFNLPSTGGWGNYKSVTFQVDPNNSEFNYLSGTVPLRLEFKNPQSSDYLFNIVNFKISNASQSLPFTYNKKIPAVLFNNESNPLDDGKVRNMGYKVGYIKNSTNITFDKLDIPQDSQSAVPKSVTITYSSGGSGGKVRFTADGNNSNRKTGIVIGEFDLPFTGGWDKYKTVTFPVTPNSELNYLGRVPAAPPLRLDFINAASSDYLFDIVDFTINNTTTP